MIVLFIVLSFSTLTAPPAPNAKINLLLTTILKNNERTSFHQLDWYFSSYLRFLSFVFSLKLFFIECAKGSWYVKKGIKAQSKKALSNSWSETVGGISAGFAVIVYFFGHLTPCWNTRFLALLSVPLCFITYLKYTFHVGLEVQIYCLECFDIGVDLGLHLAGDFAALSQHLSTMMEETIMFSCRITFGTSVTAHISGFI